MKKGWQIFWHAFFWVSIILFFMMLFHNNSRLNFHSLLVIFVLFGLVNIGLFYINYLLLIPLYLNRKKYLHFGLATLLLIFLVGFGKYGLAALYPDIILIRENHHRISFGSFYISSFFTSTIFIFLSTVLKFTLDWFLNERIQRDLENQRLSAELAFLKSQINPHFLFNSLNSIYSLAYQQSASTPQAILKLSEIMRYMLYECNDNLVLLDKELQYLQNYIDLQKIRLGDHAYVNFEVQGAIGQQQIVPLLLIAFIENAFKHGVATNPHKPINISIAISPGKLLFKLANYRHHYNTDELGGIGLSNVRRRLALLYPNKHHLHIAGDEEVYYCELSLDL